MGERETGMGGRSQAGSDGDRPDGTSQLSTIGFALWLGLIAWATEYAILLFNKIVLAQRVVWYMESMWLGALVYAAVFVGLGSAFTGWARRGPRGRLTAIRVLVGLATLSVLLVFVSLHKLAALALAIGVGHSAGSIIAVRERGATRLVRRTLAPLAGATALTVLGLVLIEPVRERIAYAGLLNAEPDAPNVILIILDTVRSRDLGLYGYERPTTPELEAFARGGVTFDRAMSTAPWTLPSHFSMLTGLYPHEMPPALDDVIDPTLGPLTPHLSDVLRERGYSTAGFVANMSYMTDESGLDRGFIHWDDHGVSLGQIAISTAPGRALLNNGRLRRLLDWHEIPIRKPAGRVVDALLNWVEDRRDRPFFVLANFFDAHHPYLPPAEFESRFVIRRPTAALRYHPHTVTWWEKRGHPPVELQSQRDMYDASIASLDHELGRLFGGLESRGLLDNTLVIVTSDHGESFGEHGTLGHTGDVHIERIQVPLLISFRGRVPAGKRIADDVTLADLPATVLDLIGIESHSMPGTSLGASWDGVAGVPGSAILSSEDVGNSDAGLLLDGWHYIRTEDGTEKLYHVAVDTIEVHDLALDPSSADRLVLLRSAFDSARSITPAQRIGRT